MYLVGGYPVEIRHGHQHCLEAPRIVDVTCTQRPHRHADVVVVLSQKLCVVHWRDEVGDTQPIAGATGVLVVIFAVPDAKKED